MTYAVRRSGRLAALCLASTLVAAAASATGSTEPRFEPGGVDVGDYLVKGYGNGGYDVAHYAIELRYRPATGVLSGTTTIRARATQDLSRFDLDFALPVRDVTVDGARADFALKARAGEPGRELVVTPATGIADGDRMTVAVAYPAKPAEAKVSGYTGWNETETGVNVWNEPTDASQWWFPGNDHPSDLAAYDVTVTTPDRLKTLTNGRRISRVLHDGLVTSHWRSGPMSTHLTFLAIGDYTVERGRVAGLPAWYAFERGGGVYVDRAVADVRRTPGVIRFLSRPFGPYPLGSAGVVSRTPHATSYETQTRPQYTALMWQYNAHNMWVVVHELAHQWFGDSVTIRRWRHIWLAEGFATYAEWLWSGAHGTGSPQRLFVSYYRLYDKDDPFWRMAVTHPWFPLVSQVYERGAMTLQALRNKVGGQTFFRIVRSWVREYAGQTASTRDFVALAERVSRRQLDRFFDVWLRMRERPAPTVRNGFPADRGPPRECWRRFAPTLRQTCGFAPTVGCPVPPIRRDRSAAVVRTSPTRRSGSRPASDSYVTATDASGCPPCSVTAAATDANPAVTSPSSVA